MGLTARAVACGIVLATMPALALADGLDDAAMESVAAQNARAPVMLDKVIRFDKASYANRTLVSTYTATNGPARRFSKPQVERAGQKLKEAIVTESCADSISRALLDRGVTFVQRVLASDGVLLVEEKVSRDDCRRFSGHSSTP